MQTLLDDMRDLLLKSEARKAINMLDVPEDERHRGKDWRAQLLDSGVPKVPSKLGGKARLSAGDGKPEEPEPDVPPLRVANPVPPAWEDDRPVRVGREAPITDPAVMGDAGERPALWNRERAGRPRLADAARRHAGPQAARTRAARVALRIAP